MALAITLLGTPGLHHDGEAASVRGHKAWALLCYLLLAELPPSRSHLATLLFGEADDPVRALRWNLSQLRQALGPDVELGGDPVTLTLPPDAGVDVQVLTRGSMVDALRLDGLGRQLLEGMSYASAPAFDLWLAAERRHLAGAAAAVLHEAALSKLAHGDAAAGADYASRLVALEPFDENANVLLVRCLRATGDAAAADLHVKACTALFERELGVSPSPALRDAAAVAGHGDAGVVGPAAILAHLEAGEAAVNAGALEAGMAALRRAAVGARAADQPELLVRVLVALGSALVHAARGSDEDGAAALHEAAALARKIGDRAAGALAHRELGYVDLLRGRYDRTRESLRVAGELAAGDDQASAWVDFVTGAAHSDQADYPQAIAALRRGIDRAGSAGDTRGAAWGTSFLARVLLLRGEHDEARQCLSDALSTARRESWTGFAPWPEALLAESELATGNVDAAEQALEHALALGQQLGDPCWESLSTRGLGLVAAAQGRAEEAIGLLDDAPKLCRRLPDAYLWVEAYALDALCGLAVDHAPQTARTWIDQLERLAGGSGMRELMVHAAMHRARLGQDGAAQAARAMARPIDNPQLHEALAGLPA